MVSVPVGPSDNEEQEVPHDPSIELEVFMTKPASPSENDGFERAIRSMRVQGIKYTVLKTGR